jgi:hypothetical protein
MTPVERDGGTQALATRPPRSPPPLGGTYGVPEAGDPIQYDELRIDTTRATWRSSYDRAILLFMTDTEAVTRIHEVCCRLDDITPSGCALLRTILLRGGWLDDRKPSGSQDCSEHAEGSYDGECGKRQQCHRKPRRDEGPVADLVIERKRGHWRVGGEEERYPPDADNPQKQARSRLPPAQPVPRQPKEGQHGHAPDKQNSLGTDVEHPSAGPQFKYPPSREEQSKHPGAQQRVGRTSDHELSSIADRDACVKEGADAYNFAILLFTTDDEAVKRIHQVCCRLDDIAGSRHPA